PKPAASWPRTTTCPLSERSGISGPRSSPPSPSC
ncbi:MAG: hypothetical protein AMXMBFR13_16620, partial [Phycisphaerae bacterium]